MTRIDRSHAVSEVDGIHSAWGWFLVLVAVFVILGLIASSHLLLATLVTVYYLGASMILAGALQITVERLLQAIASDKDGDAGKLLVDSGVRRRAPCATRS